MLWAHPVMTVTQSGLGFRISGSSAQLPRALVADCQLQAAGVLLEELSSLKGTVAVCGVL